MKASKVICLVALVAFIASWKQMLFCDAHSEDLRPAMSPLFRAVPEKWTLKYCEHPGGPEGRRFLTSEVGLNQDGELTKITYQAREPKVRTTTANQLSAKEGEEYLLLFGKMLESFSFEPAMAGYFDSDKVTFSLQSGRQSMEVEIREFSGETNIEFRSRVSKFLPQQERIDQFRNRVQPDPAKRLEGVADPWKINATISVGPKRLYRIDIESGTLRRTESDRRATARGTQKDASLQCRLTLQEYVPGTQTSLADHTIDLSEESEKAILDRALRTLRAFTFADEIKEAAGNIDVSFTLISKCPKGETTRELKITESGLSGTQFEKSVVAEFIRLVNAQIPDINRIHWE